MDISRQAWRGSAKDDDDSGDIVLVADWDSRTTNLRVWHTPTARMLWEFPWVQPPVELHGVGEIRDLVVSPDGRTALVLFGNRGSVRVYQLPVP